MHVKKIDIQQKKSDLTQIRPKSFDTFVGQGHITSIIQTAIDSATKNHHQLGHILICGPSGFGKTTLAHIIGKLYGKNVHVITGYAITKPADLISILTSMQAGDILFIDEIHRIKPALEEMLYIAMEDYAIDMVMPDGGSVRVPLKPRTLIGATTKPESMTEPLKNRFIYTFHCVEYDEDEKQAIVRRYLGVYDIAYIPHLVPNISRKVDTVPRKIHNLIVQIRDFLISSYGDKMLDEARRGVCTQWLAIDDGGITGIHRKYLEILDAHDGPLGLKTISLHMGINEESIENEIEPLLLKRNWIEKTGRGRVRK